MQGYGTARAMRLKPFLRCNTAIDAEIHRDNIGKFLYLTLAVSGLIQYTYLKPKSRRALEQGRRVLQAEKYVSERPCPIGG